MLPAFDGIRVLELGQIYNGPYCGLLFAQLGADVIKVEPPGGEQLRFRSHQPIESHEFVMLNSNKRSVALDLKTDAGRQALLDLVETADVLIENFAPGTMERLQLGPARLLEHNPRLIVASGKGYGSTGPYAHMSAMDITVQAMSGSTAATGEPDGPPTKAGFGIAHALHKRADIVITGHVADASLVVGPAAWWWNWTPDDYDALAGAVAAGHVIECGPQAHRRQLLRVPGHRRPRAARIPDRRNRRRRHLGDHQEPRHRWRRHLRHGHSATALRDR
jgi:CoA-transferase family III/Acyclic terpene utilisation family protein AtuA